MAFVVALAIKVAQIIRYSALGFAIDRRFVRPHEFPNGYPPLV